MRKEKLSGGTTEQIASLLVPQVASVRAGEHGASWQPSESARRWTQELGGEQLHAAPQDVRLSLRGSACGSRVTHAQSYQLRIDAQGVTIDAATLAGARYARATLAQILRAAGELGLASIPAMIIDDEPLIATRGVLLDVSRCRIPTMHEMFAIIDSLARLKCNHLQLYIEHTFAYAGHEEVWKGWSAITPDELAAISTYCLSRGIELAMNQNCFGHMQHWLKLPGYAHLAETHGDWMFAEAWPRSGPWSLCPTDTSSMKLVADLLQQQAACVRSEFININCDETYDIAYGRSKELVQQTSREQVYMGFVREVCGLVQSLGKRAMVWGDIALSHPECLQDWPTGAVALAWDYEPDAKFGAWALACHERGIEAWLCPGTSSWCSFVGRTSERDANLASALHAAREHDVQGVLLTDWGDFGHWQTWPFALRAIAAGLDGAWKPRHATSPAKADQQQARFVEQRAVSVQVFGQQLQSDPAIAAWIDDAGNADAHIRRVALPLSRPGTQGVLRNQSAAFADLRVAWGDLRGMADSQPWEQALANVQGLQQRMPRMASTNFEPQGLSPLMRDECEHGLACVSFALRRAIARRQTPSACDSRVQHELVELCDSVMRGHARLWRIRSRTGGLEQSMDALMRPVRHELSSLTQMPLFPQHA